MLDKILENMTQSLDTVRVLRHPIRSKIRRPSHRAQSVYHRARDLQWQNPLFSREIERMMRLMDPHYVENTPEIVIHGGLRQRGQKISFDMRGGYLNYGVSDYGDNVVPRAYVFPAHGTFSFLSPKKAHFLMNKEDDLDSLVLVAEELGISRKYIHAFHVPPDEWMTPSVQEAYDTAENMKKEYSVYRKEIGRLMDLVDPHGVDTGGMARKIQGGLIDRASRITFGMTGGTLTYGISEYGGSPLLQVEIHPHGRKKKASIHIHSLSAGEYGVFPDTQIDSGVYVARSLGVSPHNIHGTYVRATEESQKELDAIIQEKATSY